MSHQSFLHPAPNQQPGQLHPTSLQWDGLRMQQINRQYSTQRFSAITRRRKLRFYQFFTVAKHDHETGD